MLPLAQREQHSRGPDLATPGLYQSRQQPGRLAALVAGIVGHGPIRVPLLARLRRSVGAA